MITSFPFGAAADGQAVTAWRIASGSMSATILDYGATIQSLTVPDRYGNAVDVVLGYDTVGEYEQSAGYLGATIGRVGNRIGGACFALNGKTYQLAKNNGENHLHGGIKNFSKVIWHAEAVGEDTVKFSRLSPDGEENYPGNLQVSVSFTLSDGALTIRYDADTDADTLVNLTNHAYFNLNGGGSALAHLLQVNAEKFTENDAGCLPTGKFIAVDGTPFDFRTAKPIGQDIGADDVQLRNGEGYDHNFVLTGARDAAVLYSGQSGIRMTTRTTMPGVQVYSANHLTPRRGKGGASYDIRHAICLETQLYPNAMRCYGFPSPVLHAGEHLHSETVYAFDVK